MPAPISAPAPVDALVKRVEKAGNAFSQRAMELSNAIEAIAQRLDLMNGKLPAKVQENGTTVGFEKRGKHWLLYLIDEETPEDFGEAQVEALVGVSILRKAKAFGLLLKVLAELELEQKRQLEIVNSALGALPAPANPGSSISVPLNLLEESPEPKGRPVPPPPRVKFVPPPRKAEGK